MTGKSVLMRLGARAPTCPRPSLLRQCLRTTRSVYITSYSRAKPACHGALLWCHIEGQLFQTFCFKL